MASWTVPVTHATGDVLAVSDWNGVANDLTFLYEAPYINAYASASVSVAPNTIVNVSLDSTVMSAYGASVDTSTGNVAMPLAGLYWVNGVVQLAMTASGTARTEINQNGTEALNGTSPYNGGTENIWSAASGILVANAGDVLGSTIQQNSSATLTGFGGNHNANLSAFFVGSQ
jgi:hypothetical protein